MKTAKQQWKEKAGQVRREYKQAKERGAVFDEQFPTVKGEIFHYFRDSWNKCLKVERYNQLASITEHANVHQFLNDISEGTDTLDLPHVQMVRAARVAAVKEGFKLP